MANINRGEYDLTVDGQEYSLALGLDDLANLENVLDIGADDLFQRIKNNVGRVSHVNAVVLRALQKGKPRLTRKEADDLLPHIPFTDRKLAAGMLIAGALNYLNEQNPELLEEAEQNTEKKESRADPLSSQAANSTGEN